MIINFDRLGQSGGGSGSGSTVVWRQDLSAGTQIAQITINGRPQSVYAPTAQGGGDYQVVSALPASAEEGQLFYVPAHSGTTTLRRWEIYDPADNDMVGDFEDGDEIYIELHTGENHSFRLGDDDWIPTGDTPTFMRVGGIDFMARCDGEGHCWIYIWDNTIEFAFTPQEEGATYQDSTYDVPGEIVPAATYRYLNGEFVLVPEGGLIHLETLSGVSGETGIMYECDGELYYWNENSGIIGKWNVLPATGTSMTYHRNWFTFKYSSVSAATQLISFTTGTGNNPAYVLINPDRTLTGVNYAGQTKTIAVGETKDIYFRSGDYYWTVVNNGNSISMAPIADNLVYQSKIVSIWDGNTNQPHWEMVNKTITPYVSGGTSTTTIGIPRVSSDGQILSYDQTNTAGLKVNGTNRGCIYTTQQTQTLNWYIPTTSGISGQILQSNGNAAPTWTDMPSAGGPTVIDFDNMSQAELEALYGTLSGATSANSINTDYVFFKSFDDRTRGVDGPIRLQFITIDAYSEIQFGASLYDMTYGCIAVFSFRLFSDGTYDKTAGEYKQGISGLTKKRVFRDHQYLYFNPATSGFSYDDSGTLTPITYGTGSTCSGMWVFEVDMINALISDGGSTDQIGWFGVEINTAEGVRKYVYPSFSAVELTTPVAFTDSDSNTVNLTHKAYFDYGEFVISFCYNSDWRFGGLDISFR